MTTIDPTLKTRGDFSSTSFVSNFASYWYFSVKLTATATIISIRNVSIILFRKAISGNSILNNIEIGMVSKTAHNAALEVVRFQNNPVKKMHNTPGVTNPVYSWINENSFPIETTAGVTIIARRSAVAVTNLPILTR